MKSILSYLLSFLFITHSKADNNLNHSKITELEHKLFDNYNPTIIPTNNMALNLSLGVAFRAFNNIDQKEGVVSLNLWLRYWWNDYNLRWDENEWNISSLIVSTDPGESFRVWTPDIYLYNTAENPLENLKWSNVEISSNGNILWSRPGIMQSTCSFDMTNFPYDVQTCEMKFGSWSYTGSHLILQEATPTIDLTNYQPNVEWEMQNVEYSINSLKYECCPEEYYDITFTFNLVRLSGYYETNIIIPTFATASLILVTLLIPWDSGERISFAVTVMLSIIVFLLILSDTLPKSNQQPLLSRMIMALTFFSLFGVFFTVLISALNNYKDEKLKGKEKIDNRLVRWLYNTCSYICLLKKNKNNQCIKNRNSDISPKNTKESSKQNTSSNSYRITNTNNDEFNKAQELLEGITYRTISYENAFTKRNITSKITDKEESTQENKKENIEENNETSSEENITEIELGSKKKKKSEKKTELQKECEKMIGILETIYSIIFLLSFIILCIFMFSSQL